MTQTPSPEWIHTLAPYQPGKPASELERELGIGEIVKLASNENPYGPSPAAIEAIGRAAATTSLYPDPSSFELRAALATQCGVPSEQVVVGNGSNALITNLVRTFCRPGDAIVASEYGFVAYRIVANAAGVRVNVAAEKDFETDVDALIEACDAATRILFVANPNNPTGTWLDRASLERLCEGVPEGVLLVIDEAYYEYAVVAGCPDALALRSRRENLAVMRTFSKAYGLAGCRVGYVVAPEYVAERLQRMREPFDVNHLGQAAALAALRDPGFVQRCVRVNATERERVDAALRDMGLRVWRSAGNFLLFETEFQGREVFEAMLRRGVIVRPLGAYDLPRHLRVTIGTEHENSRFIEAISETLTSIATARRER